MSQRNELSAACHCLLLSTISVAAHCFRERTFLLLFTVLLLFTAPLKRAPGTLHDALVSGIGPYDTFGRYGYDEPKSAGKLGGHPLVEM